MDLRQHQRFSVRFKVFLTPSDRPEHEGVLLNLSLGGCAIATLTTGLTKGSTVILKLEVPRSREPIQVERGLIRWIKDDLVGVQFASMSLRNQERLKAVIQQLEAEDQAGELP
ncbi:PilZ domain-containing protein [Candidatus Nitrospira bockiana]